MVSIVVNFNKFCHFMHHILKMKINIGATIVIPYFTKCIVARFWY